MVVIYINVGCLSPQKIIKHLHPAHRSKSLQPLKCSPHIVRSYSSGNVLGRHDALLLREDGTVVWMLHYFDTWTLSITLRMAPWLGVGSNIHSLLTVRIITLAPKRCSRIYFLSGLLTLTAKLNLVSCLWSDRPSLHQSCHPHESCSCHTLRLVL